MTYLVWPNGSTKEPARSDGYGPRGRIPGVNTRPFHVGQDWYGIGALRAIGAGTVVEVGWGGWAGNQVLIYLGEIGGVRTWVRYCHLETPSPLRRGATVSRGQIVGTEGTTGASAGVHLHLEIYRGRVDRGTGGHPGATVDPRAFIKKYLLKPEGTTTRKEDEDMRLVWDTTGTGYLVTTDGTLPIGSPLIYNLLYRLINSNQSATPFALEVKPFISTAVGGKPHEFTRTEVGLIDAQFKLLAASVKTGVAIDVDKLADALGEALGEGLTVTAEITAEDLARAYEGAAPRIIRAIGKAAAGVPQ